MWNDLKINNVGALEKCIAEYIITLHHILPNEKVKLKSLKIKKED
jgi:hypothetical protein